MTAMQTKWALRKALRRHHLIEQPKMNPLLPTWGKAARANSKRFCGSAEMAACIAKLTEQTPASRLRNGLVHGYMSIMGSKEGGTVQKAIARWCGISDREPWCAETLTWVAKVKAGYDGPLPVNPYFVPAWEEFAARRGLIVDQRDALPGDVVTFVWAGPHGVGRGEHIGIIVKTGLVRHTIAVNPITAEGNAGGPGGDAVRLETRFRWNLNTVFDLGRLQT